MLSRGLTSNSRKLTSRPIHLGRIFVTWWFVILWKAESAVLDPALYLYPSPPIMPSSAHAPGSLWSQTRIERNAGDLSVIPIGKIHIESQDKKVIEQRTKATTEQPESMEEAETFWPRLRTTTYGFGGIHIPLTFSLTGTYGRYGTAGSTGVIGSSYASVSDASSGFGKAGLAGSSYGSFSYPGTRVYGGSGAAAWNGWGNGKWGHYGKG